MPRASQTGPGLGTGRWQGGQLPYFIRPGHRDLPVLLLSPPAPVPGGYSAQVESPGVSLSG